MIFNDELDAAAFIKKHQNLSSWVSEARDYHKVLKALILGENFGDVLIHRIEKIESADRQIARKNYSKDIRDLFDRVYQPRTNVFSASGGSVQNDISLESQKKKFIESLNQFKGQKSLEQYLSEDYFRLADTDPNGVIFLEYIEDINIEPTYKSINDIRTYISNGQLCEVILFEPKQVKMGKVLWNEWRIVDDKTDYRFREVSGNFTLIEEKTFDHPFGNVPATILSNIKTYGSEKRISNIFPIEELAKDYARDKSILTIYKFQNGFPRHWAYGSKCRSCSGTGKTGDSGSCTQCVNGVLTKKDVTDTTIVELPRDSDSPIIAPNVEGFVSPDLETWTQYNTDLKNAEELIDATAWGTKRVASATNETATGRFIDVQPVINKLTVFTNIVQWVDNQLSDWVENWVNGSPKDQSEYFKTYGTRYIIESADIVLDKYNEAKVKGDAATILDKLFDEYLLAKHHSNVIMLNIALKKKEVEPHIHYSTKEVFDWFGQPEAWRKSLFVDFWEIADADKTVEQLNKDFDTYVKDNPLEITNNLNIKPQEL